MSRGVAEELNRISADYELPGPIYGPVPGRAEGELVMLGSRLGFKMECGAHA